MVKPQNKVRAKGLPASTQSPETLDRTISNAVGQQLGKNVSAFMLMSLDEDGHVSIHASKHVKSWTESVFTLNASEQLRHAHKVTSETADIKAPINEKDHDLTFPSIFKQRSRTVGSFLPLVHWAGRSPTKRAARLLTATDHSEEVPADKSSASELEADETKPSSDEDDAAYQDAKSVLEPPPRMITVTIGNELEVEQFLRSRLKGIQQLAVKRIAKQWIKGICPKKQGSFPYRKNKNHRVPAWWPPTNLCRFREPDHIKRSERLELCVHLLRLRPTPETLKQWNEGVEPHPTHVSQGWVQFLMELAPPASFWEMRGETRERSENREKLMKTVYDLALEEQRYEDGEYDNTDTFSYPDDLPTPVVGKKARVDTPDSDSESESEESEPTSIGSKRRKINPSTAAPSIAASDACHTDLSMTDSKLPSTDVMHLDRDAKPDVDMTDATAKFCAEQASKDMQRCHSNFTDSKQSMPMPQQWQTFDMTYGGGANLWTTQGFSSAEGWPEARSATSSFDYREPFKLDVSSNTSPGKQSYCFPQAGNALQQPMSQHVYPAHMVTSLSHPHFDTVPNTPLISPSHLLSLTNDQAHATPSVYRPNGHGWHGLPAYGSHACYGVSGNARPVQQSSAFDQQPSLPLRQGDNQLEVSPYHQRHSHAGHPEHQHVSRFEATPRFDRNAPAYGHGANNIRY